MLMWDEQINKIPPIIYFIRNGTGVFVCVYVSVWYYNKIVQINTESHQNFFLKKDLWFRNTTLSSLEFCHSLT